MRRFRGPAVSDERKAELAAGRRSKAEWVRFEIECRNRCDKLKTDIYPAVNSLLIAGKADHSTRESIGLLIRYQEQVERVQLNKKDLTTLRQIFERTRRNGKSKNNTRKN